MRGCLISLAKRPVQSNLRASFVNTFGGGGGGGGVLIKMRIHTEHIRIFTVVGNSNENACPL